MTEEDAFFQAMLEAPDDDAPRLIFTDWLQERGDTRGDFIRKHNDLSQTGPDEVRRRHEENWFGPLLKEIHSYDFERGFLKQLTLQGTSGLRLLIKHAETFFGLSLVLRLGLFQSDDPGSDATLDADAVRAFAQLPHLSRVRALTISGYRESGNYSSNFIDATGVRILCKSPYLTSLASLNLGGNELKAAGPRAIVDSPNLARLGVLSLSGSAGFDWDGSRVSGWSNIGPSGVVILAKSPFATRLTELDISWNDIDDAAVEALIGSPYLDRLTRLGLEDDCVSPRGREALRARIGERVSLHWR
jgi:uncharacterized protein (TIGR02996 family)